MYVSIHPLEMPSSCTQEWALSRLLEIVCSPRLSSSRSFTTKRISITRYKWLYRILLLFDTHVLLESFGYGLALMLPPPAKVWICQQLVKSNGSKILGVGELCFQPTNAIPAAHTNSATNNPWQLNACFLPHWYSVLFSVFCLWN
jgi:hypothetical protein